MLSEAPRLSLCVIARDEEANLPRLLASVDGLVDEIVVADTGSTDRTVDIAKQAGAIVTHFAWCDDFSAAYNHALDNATGEWILLLDADEELVPDCHDEIRRLIDCNDAFAYIMYRQDFYGDTVSDNAFSEMLQTRLFRRRDSVRFAGRIHQQLEPRLSLCAESEGRRTIASNVRFRHYGYMGDYRARKSARTIHLLTLELAERPDSFYYLVELGRAKLHAGDLTGAGELRRAAEQLVSGRQRIHSDSGSLEMLLEELLCRPELPQDFPLSIAQLEEIAAEHFANSVPLLWQRALRRYRANDFAAAATSLEQILAHAEAGSYSRLVSFPPEIMNGSALLNLGVCYVRLTKFAQAAECFRRIESHPEHGEAARGNLAALRKSGLL